MLTRRKSKRIISDRRFSKKFAGSGFQSCHPMQGFEDTIEGYKN